MTSSSLSTTTFFEEIVTGSEADLAIIFSLSSFLIPNSF